MRGHQMGHYSLLVLFIFAANILVTHGITSDTRKHCCILGTNYSTSGLECHTFQLPIAGVEKSDESQCLKFIDVCCKNHYREKQCNIGRDDAKSPNGCTATSDNERKVCCEACQMGLEMGKSGESCFDTAGLSPPYDQVLISCCETVSTTTSTTPRISSTSAVITTPVSVATPKPSRNQDPDYPLPSMESLCESGETCAQICEPTVNSYKCSCYKGYTLMEDGISCKPIQPISRKEGRCAVYNPCEHNCIDTGTAIKCTCKEGYELSTNKRSCNDIDECARNIHECTKFEECVNEVGSYVCYELEDAFDDNINFDENCGAGYKFNGEKHVCDDIDECEFGIMCARPKTCKNTIGSFICEGDDIPQCPPGFNYKAATESCADIDECLTGDNNCDKDSQICLNIKGNYTCVDKASRCPPGFKKSTLTQLCEDINECDSNIPVCKDDEVCVNESGGHSCIKSNGSQPATQKSTKSTYFTTITTPKYTTSTTQFSDTTQPKPVNCARGFRYSKETYSCVDINECIDDPEACDSNQECFNTPGSFICNCKFGFTKDFKTSACVDINECQLQTHDCSVAERCDNTIGSYHCARITGCGTGYTLNLGSSLCEDDDECALGTHKCNELGPNYRCRNLVGSYRCEFVPQSTKPQLMTTPSTRPVTYPTRFQVRPQYPVISGQLKKCLPGYRMNERGECEDVNECESNPCGRSEKCVNFNGRYQCMLPKQLINCKYGYELNEEGDTCVDINECSRGTHKCQSTQICVNYDGYYTCNCPPGHILNNITKRCEDMDECKMFRPCPYYSDCINTVGSFKCDCKSGLRNVNNVCKDIDECQEIPNLCEHNCVNIFGGYRCACNSGFTLHYDNRTCTDVDECERFKSRHLCVGTCVNIPGSYKCDCPKGYKLGGDGRICVDIDECQRNVCGPEDSCLNTRGGYKCFQITCPPNYIKDPQHRARCKRPQNLCDPRDYKCLMLPEQYTYQYMSLVSNLQLSGSPVQLFQIKGPSWTSARADFNMEIMEVHCPSHVPPANEQYFKKEFNGINTMQLFLTKPITGPQEIKLKIRMHLYQGNSVLVNVVVYFIIVVSEYPF